MILDNNALFSDKQDLFIAAPGQIESTSVYDFGETGSVIHTKDGVNVETSLQRRLGVGGKIPFFLSVNEDILGAYSSITIRMRTSDAVTAGALSGTITDVLEVTVAKADLVKGYYHPLMMLPREIKGRYMDMEFDIAGGAVTASVGDGHVTAGFVPAADGNNTFS